MFVNMTVNCMTDVGYWIPPAWLLCLESVSHLLVSRPVCPDVEIKSSPKIFKNAPKVATSVFTYKVEYFKIAQKVTKYLDYFWKKNLLPRTLKNRPIRPHWSLCRPFVHHSHNFFCIWCIVSKLGTMDELQLHLRR